jgi:amino acid adenylation domain-containing protein
MAFFTHELVSEAAREDPDHIALRWRGASMTYGELDAQANALAHALIGAGVRRGDRVAVAAPKRPETIVAVFACMKAGAAYVAIDLSSPEQRAAEIAAQCRFRALVTTPALAAPLLGALGEHRPDALVLIDDGAPAATEPPAGALRFADIASRPSEAPAVPIVEDDLALIAFTSGSTGVPKGAMIPHRCAVAMTRICLPLLGMTPDDRMSGMLPLHFAASVFEIFNAFCARATLVLIQGEDVMLPGRLEQIIREEDVTCVLSVPSLIRMVLGSSANENPFPTVRLMWFGGEEFPSPQVRELMRRVPQAAVYNLYAGTESLIRTLHRIEEPPADDERLALGTAPPNVELIVLRDDGRIAGPGEEGELCVRSPMVTPGYWADPQKTAEALIPYPLLPELGAQMLRTGDMVRIRPDGVLEHVGRGDDQVKSRGVRIELGEIDTAASAHPSVSEAAAVAVPHETWGNLIALCVVPRAGAEIDASELKRFLGERLPMPMVPARIEVLAELPKGSTGKIDRRRLTALMSGPIGDQE